jgi:hypothetical protein
LEPLSDVAGVEADGLEVVPEVGAAVEDEFVLSRLMDPDNLRATRAAGLSQVILGQYGKTSRPVR